MKFMAEEKQKENLYKATYLGSGSFQITKPKRGKSKLHLARVHDGRKRARRH
jgi:hypothetical protein